MCPAVSNSTLPGLDFGALKPKTDIAMPLSNDDRGWVMTILSGIGMFNTISIPVADPARNKD